MSDLSYISKKIHKYQKKMDREMAKIAQEGGNQSGGAYDKNALNRVSILRVNVQNGPHYDIALDENAKAVLDALFCNISTMKLVSGAQKLAITVTAAAIISGKCVSDQCNGNQGQSITNGADVRVRVKVCVVPHMDNDGSWKITYMLYATEVPEADSYKPEYLGCVQLISIVPTEVDETAKVLTTTALTPDEASKPAVMEQVSASVSSVSSTVTVPAKAESLSEPEKEQIISDAVLNKDVNPQAVKEHAMSGAAEAVKAVSVEAGATKQEASKIKADVQQQQPVQSQIDKRPNPQLSQQIREIASVPFKAVGSVVEGVSGLFGDVVGKFGQVASDIGQDVGKGVQHVGKVIQGASSDSEQVTRVQEQLKKLLTESKAQISKTPEQLADLRQKLTNALNNSLESNEIKNQANALLNQLKQSHDNAITQLNSAIQQARQNKSIDQLQQSIMDARKQLPSNDALLNQANSLLNDLQQSSRQLQLSAQQQINSGLQSAQQRINPGLNKLLEAAKKNKSNMSSEAESVMSLRSLSEPVTPKQKIGGNGWWSSYGRVV